jgi:hypothetical protein
MVELPGKRERDYIAAVGIAAVLVTSTGMVRASRDLAASRRALGVDITGAWWLKDVASADRLARAVTRRIGEREVGAAVALEAARLGLTLTAHAVVMRRAAVAAGNVEDALRAANERGELAWFNSAFKARRLDGEAVPYRAAWARLRRAVVRRLLVAGRLEFGPELLAEVFKTEISTPAMPVINIGRLDG